MGFATGEHEALRYGESKIDNRNNREVVPQFLSVAQGSRVAITRKRKECGGCRRKKRSNECTGIQSIMNGDGCEDARKEKSNFATEEKRNRELAYPVHSAREKHEDRTRFILRRVSSQRSTLRS